MSMLMNLFVSAVAVALGAFVVASPHQAAKIWGSQRLDSLKPKRRDLFVRWYRAFGILLCLTGVLYALDTIALPHYLH
jgi:hypothetical protein